MRDNALADFLNHGVLPFAGREQERSRLLAFWHSTTDANGLRAALVTGEAGIGKSRLLEEVVPEILSEGGAVIHIKFYQESATALVPLLARAVWNSVAGRELLKSEPEPNFDALLNALRRIASLRPTVVVIEDIQLLQSGGTMELANLLESLSYETLSLIITMRPVTTPTRSIIEQYLTEEVSLEGLHDSAIKDICDVLFDRNIESEAVSSLERATLGNALAVRSALRGALKTGFLFRHEESGKWKMSVPPNAFFRHLENNVRSLSEGMAAHLDEAERVACEALAVLGELFSVEAASELVKEPQEILNRLRFKGMLTISASAHTVLMGQASAYPLYAFSHSLLHKYFYDNTYIWGDELVRVITSGTPLYGIAPYLLLERKDITDATSSSRIGDLLKNMITLVSRLDNSSDWELGFVVHDALANVFEKNKKRLSPEDTRDIEFEVLRTKLTLLRRSIPNPAYKPLLDRLIALTSDIKSTKDAERGLVAAMCEYWYLRRAEDADKLIPALQEKVDAIACAFPDVVITRPYRILLSYFAQYASENSSYEQAEAVERRIKIMLAHNDSTPQMRNFVLGYIYPEFLNIFSTKQELAEKRELAGRIEGLEDYLRASYLTSKGDLLLDTGSLIEARKIVERSIILFRERGFRYSLYSANIKKLCINALLGGEVDNIIGLAQSFTSLLPNDPTIHSGARRIIAQRLVPLLLLIGREDIANIVVRDIMPEKEPANVEHLLLLALRNGEGVSNAAKMAPKDNRYGDIFESVRTQSIDKMVRAIEEYMKGDILRINDILGVALGIELLAANGAAKKLGGSLQTGIEDVLTWLYERNIVTVLSVFLDRYGDFLADKELKSWKQKVSKLRKKVLDADVQRGSGKIMLSLLGSIEYTLPSGAIERVRGARLRSVIGAMTANAMLSEPMNHKEFCVVASGGNKEDLELARKTVNMAVVALRDDLGAEAILTTGDTPMLNLDRVRIDLLEASDLLNDASKHLRRGSIMKALADLNEAMTIALGKIPFPTLYDNLFEALRDDFDARIRKTTLDIAKRLLAEGDTQSAVNVLRHYFDSMPDDEEAAALLRNGLIQLGQTGEAERIRIKTSEAVGA